MVKGNDMFKTRKKVFANGKKIACKTVVIMFIMFVITVPVYAYSTNWAMEMSTNGRIVDGEKNGAFHKLDAGKVSINGTIFTHSNANGNGQPTNKLHFSLYNKTSGNYFGSIDAKPSGYAYGEVDFSGTYEESVGGGTKYYLYIWRSESDGTHVSASGKLKNE